MANWPASLEQCPVLGWSESPVSNIVEFQTDVGPPKRRRRSSNAGSNVYAEYKLNHTDLATFWTFYQTTIADGVLSFSISNPRTGAAVTAYFVDAPEVRQEASQLYILSCNFRVFP